MESPKHSRPPSASGLIEQSSRPVSASHAAQSRPKSALLNLPNAPQILLDLEKNIRMINKKIRLIQRDKIIKAMQPSTATQESEERPKSRKGNDDDDPPKAEENTIDPLLDLEEQKHKLLQRYEQINQGVAFEPSSEALVYDFCDLLYFECHQRPMNAFYLAKYFDSQVILNIVGYKTFQGRENIISILLKRYENLLVQHQILDIRVEKEPFPGFFLSANVTVNIYIDQDAPRKVLQILHFIKSNDKGPFDVVIKKEMFIVQDARPLYHFAEEDAPISSLQKEYNRLKDLKEQEEKERLLRLQQESEEDGDEGESLEEKSYEDEQSHEGSQSLKSGSVKEQINGIDENNSIESTEKRNNQPRMENDEGSINSGLDDKA